MRRLITYLRADPIWWLSLGISFFLGSLFILAIQEQDTTKAVPASEPEMTFTSFGSTAQTRESAAAAPTDAGQTQTPATPAPARPDCDIMPQFNGQDLSLEVVRVFAQTTVIMSARGFGNGILVRPDVVLTAAHVVPEPNEAVTAFCLGKVRPAKVLYRDYQTDVAVLAVAGCGGETIEIVNRQPPVDEVLLISYFEPEKKSKRGNLEMNQSLDLVSAIPGATMNPDLMEEATVRLYRTFRQADGPLPLAVSGAAQPGMSGSALADGCGRVLGVLRISDRPHNRTFVAPGSTLLAALKAAGLE
ncbi:hypothetical protein A3C96_03570 [Candidatus Uhrbacteria bacterium RIFCSPHIGHO2_02_FULL_60_10]|uniref:Serine protease n=1 Tax=Candidatus Uhrbacteria bacterium RIFCSPHIGHO2_02_FULL_60_10 TaxID=1802392 RepID=A0A1F7U8A7_9BACT|nr:MAG: hypothetical protein A3C96_03570 [Candidatus Uhrbacteria bacterium RIFCSPHIGHO2_02_FULL_60_10]